VLGEDKQPRVARSFTIPGLRFSAASGSILDVTQTKTLTTLVEMTQPEELKKNEPLV
jgi:hypothetical protein